MTSSVSLEPLAAAPLGARVHGLDPRALGASDEETLRAALVDYGVLVVSGLSLTPDQHVALTRVFGDPAIHPIEAIRLTGHPEIIVLAVDIGGDLEDGDPRAREVVGHIPWHTDLTYTATPSRGALLYALEVPPEGGETGFIDTAAVCDALPKNLLDRATGRRAIHGVGPIQGQLKSAVATLDEYSGPAVPDFPHVVHPLVHRHPHSGRRVLNISPAFMQAIVGMPDDESERLLAELRAFATQDRFAYHHQWQAGDLVIWDNWRTMHTATGHQQRYARRMHRTTLRGDAPLPAWTA